MIVPPIEAFELTFSVSSPFWSPYLSKKMNDFIEARSITWIPPWESLTICARTMGKKIQKVGKVDEVTEGWMHHKPNKKREWTPIRGGVSYD